MKELKKRISMCLVTTTLALLILSVVALFYQGTVIYIATVFQTFFVCSVMQLALWLVEKWESSYVFLEILLQYAVVIGIVLLGGYFFNWFQNLPGIVLVGMSVLVYLLLCILETSKVRAEIDRINELVEKQEKT